MSAVIPNKLRVLSPDESRFLPSGEMTKQVGESARRAISSMKQGDFTMSLMGWVQIFLFYLAILSVTKPMGQYLYRVMETGQKPFAGIIDPILEWAGKLGGQDLKKEQTWVE